MAILKKSENLKDTARETERVGGEEGEREVPLQIDAIVRKERRCDQIGVGHHQIITEWIDIQQTLQNRIHITRGTDISQSKGDVFSSLSTSSSSIITPSFEH